MIHIQLIKLISTYDGEEKVEVYEERQSNGQWLKTIEFKLPIIEHDMKLSLDNGVIEVEIKLDEFDLMTAERKATYYKF